MSRFYVSRFYRHSLFCYIVLFLISKQADANALEVTAEMEKNRTAQPTGVEKANRIGAPGRVSFLQAGSRDFRGGIGNILTGAIDAVFPQSCIADILNFGYTSTKHGEDDYGFMPRCKSPSDANNISCFPRTARVLTPDGSRPISEVTIGTQVAVGWDSRTNVIRFEPVLFFLHQDPKAQSTSGFLQLVWRLESPMFEESTISNSTSQGAVATGVITLWPEHLVFVCPNTKSPPTPSSCTISRKANEVNVRDRLIATTMDPSGNSSPQAVEVIETRRVAATDHRPLPRANPFARETDDTRQMLWNAAWMLDSDWRSAIIDIPSRVSLSPTAIGDKERVTGAYAPVTWSGTILVDGTWTSQYSSVPSNLIDFLGFMDETHRAAHFLTWPLRMAAQWMPANPTTTARFVEWFLQALERLHKQCSLLRKGNKDGHMYNYRVSGFHRKGTLANTATL